MYSRCCAFAVRSFKETVGSPTSSYPFTTICILLHTAVYMEFIYYYTLNKRGIDCRALDKN